jgi:hypothetical protein
MFKGMILAGAALAACGTSAIPGRLPNADDGGAPGSTLVLEPDTIAFFGLPIDSIRFGISGYDPARRLRAVLIWDFSNTGMRYGAHCDDFREMFPYALVVADADGGLPTPYAGNVQVLSASGCVDFRGLSSASMDFVDVSVKVDGPAFRGTIIASNRATLAPAPVILGIEYRNVPGYAVEPSDWVTLRQGADPVTFFDRCDLQICGQPSPCGPQMLQVLPASSAGRLYHIWDGKIRTPDPTGCYRPLPAPPGDYTARFCLGYSDAAGVSHSPVCHEMSFRYPVERVVWDADFGG